MPEELATIDTNLRLDDLPLPERCRIRALMAACQWLDGQLMPTKCFARAAAAATDGVAGLRRADGGETVASRPVSPKTMERYYYAWKSGKRSKAGELVAAAGSWQCFLDARIVAANRKQARTALPAFRAHLALLFTRHKAVALSAIRELRAEWLDAKPIPGYEGLNPRRGMPYPAGWSNENLMRCFPPVRDARIVREGIKAAYNELPQLFRTRKGGWPCCEVYFDDVWLDFEAVGYDSEGKLQIGRPLQLGCLDGYTGRRLCWGTKIRTDRKDGTSVGLNADEMLFLLCDYLHNVGYSPRGTVLVMEHGTAHLSDAVKDKLFQMTGGLVRVEEGSIQGLKQPGSVYGGRGSGNPRRKAMLEEWHSIQRNYLDGMVTYTGHDRTEPEALHGIREATKKLLTAQNNPLLPAVRRELLAETAPSLHDVTDLLIQVVGAINSRTDHALTDWAACGFTVLEFAPDGRTWTALDAMRPAARQFALEAIKADPSLMRQRLMSPQEAWESSTAEPQNKLLRFNCAQIVELLAAVRPVKLPPIKGGAIRINNRRIWHEELIYRAEVITAQGFRRELPSSGDYWYVFNPQGCGLYVLDAKGTVLGEAQIMHRVPFVDDAAKLRELGKIKHHLAERLEAAAVMVAPDLAAQEIKRQHNADVLNGAPVDALGRLDAARLQAPRRRSAAAAAQKPLCSPVQGLGLADDYDDEPTFPEA